VTTGHAYQFCLFDFFEQFPLRIVLDPPDDFQLRRLRRIGLILQRLDRSRIPLLGFPQQERLDLFRGQILDPLLYPLLVFVRQHRCLLAI